MDLITPLVSIGSSGLVATGLTFMVGALRRGSSAEITKRVNEAAMSQVDQLQERVKEAEASVTRTQQRMHEVEEESEATRQQMRAVHREASDLAERLATMARWVHDPGMSIERLRLMVPAPGGVNGSG